MSILAIYVSKDSLDFYSDFISRGVVENSYQGILDLFNRCVSSANLSIDNDDSTNPTHSCTQYRYPFILVLESTGVYSFDIADFFSNKSVWVFWVKTDKMKVYRKLFNRQKTDRIDAKLIFDIASKFPDSLVPFINNINIDIYNY